jgi:hypothetical protein
MRNLLVGIWAAAAATLCQAEPLNLKCAVNYPNGEISETWLVIDTALNLMRVDGMAHELSLTNDAYVSVSRPVGGFVTVRRVDRVTGELTTTDLYGSHKVNPRKGVCEKAVPPATKF